MSSPKLCSTIRFIRKHKFNPFITPYLWQPCVAKFRDFKKEQLGKYFCRINNAMLDQGKAGRSKTHRKAQAQIPQPKFF